MPTQLEWRGRQVEAHVVTRLIRAADEIGLRIEAEAKAELYPGHGKVTGTLQRSIQSEGGRREGSTIRVRVATKGVRYARPVHRRYAYLTAGLSKVRPRVLEIIRKHTGGDGGGAR